MSEININKSTGYHPPLPKKSISTTGIPSNTKVYASSEPYGSSQYIINEGSIYTNLLFDQVKINGGNVDKAHTPLENGYQNCTVAATSSLSGKPLTDISEIDHAVIIHDKAKVRRMTGGTAFKNSATKVANILKKANPQMEIIQVEAHCSDEVHDALEKQNLFIEETAGKENTLYYYIGHGYAFNRPNRDGDIQGESHVCINEDDIESHVQENLYKTKNQWIIIDQCGAGHHTE